VRGISAVFVAALVVALVLATAVPGPVLAASSSPAWGRRGMVVSSQGHATRAGVEMLAQGGNAIDAAVAAAFAVGVAQPYSTGIGGGGFLLIRLADGRIIALDARETAPAAATRDMYVEPGVPERASVLGPLAVATPGMVAGLALALEQWGTLPLWRVLQPAIRLAEDGFKIGPVHAKVLERMRGYGLPERFPETGRIHFPPAEKPALPGWSLVQRDLAKTLKRIAEQGPRAFYGGSTSLAIARYMAKNGGLVTREDLAAYEPTLRQPVHGSYRGLQVYSFPPPSSGGAVLIQMLNILEGFDLHERGAGSSASMHIIAEAMKLAFADRAVWMGDPDFVDVPVAKLTSKEYGEDQRARINPAWWRRAPWRWGQGERAISVKGSGLPMNDAGTAHLSVTDKQGNAVAFTGTINTPFGSGITVPGTGIILNNEMDDFAKAPNEPNVYGLVDVRGANAIAPGKRPLSSMTPTVVLREGKPYLVTGSPGGPRIISTVLLSILNKVDYGMDIQEAVSAPRFHHQWVPDTVFVERAVPEDVREGLRQRGHRVIASPHNWSSAQAIFFDEMTGLFRGGSDPRSDGLALGF
jgi:gamma-glutamyltranspeptidase/glutathione hydrolase